KTISVDEHYQQMADRGLSFGPAFRAMTSLQLGKNEALARVDLSGALASEIPSYFLHPAILDAALQAIAILLPQGSNTYLPLSVETIKVFHCIDTGGWSHALIKEESRSGHDVVTADVSVFDNDGQLLVSLAGITMKQVS